MKNKLVLAAIIATALMVTALWGATVIGYSDWSLMSAPGNPASGFLRLYSDSGSNTVKCKTSSGTACTFASSGSGTVTSVTATAPLTSSGGATPDISATYQGNGSSIQLATGGFTSGDCVKFDASGNVVDFGAACGGGGGGTQNHGLGMSFGVSGGTALTTSTQYVTSTFTCAIASWNAAIDQGAITFDVWKIAAGPADWHGGSGTVNTAGTAVTWVSGVTFPADSEGRTITINSVVYAIATRVSSTSLTLASSAGTQTGVAFSSPGTAVPTVTNSITASAKPAISSGTFAGDTVVGGGLAGWNLNVTKNDILGFNINAVSGGTTTASLVLECNQ